jgi:hypothetical protein
MDIMIEMDLSNKGALSTYLDHDIHKRLIDAISDHVTKRVSFDYERNFKKELCFNKQTKAIIAIF